MQYNAAILDLPTDNGDNTWDDILQFEEDDPLSSTRQMFKVLDRTIALEVSHAGIEFLELLAHSKYITMLSIYQTHLKVKVGEKTDKHILTGSFASMKA